MRLKYLLVLGWLFSMFQLVSQDQRIEYFSGNPEDSLEIMEMLSMARGVYRTQKFDSVIAFSESILLYALSIDFTRGIGEAYFLKARALNQLGNREKAIEIYKKALESFESLNDHLRMASAYNNWGLILKATGKFREAISAGENALGQIGSMPVSSLNFHILNNLGNSYQNLAQFKNAASSYYQALEVLKTQSDTTYRERLQAEVFINLGIIYLEQKLFSKSLEISHEARTILERQQMKPQLATVYINLGETYTKTQDYKYAENYLRLAYNLYEELNNKVGVAVSINNFGEILYEQHKYDEAIDKHLLAIQELKNVQATAYLSSCYLGLGKTYLRANMQSKAQLALMNGLQLALKSGQKVQVLKLYEVLITLHKSVDELEMALMYYDLHSALSQELNHQQIGRFIGQQELKEHVAKRDLALQSLQSEAALLSFQITQRNILLFLSISVIILISVVFTMVYQQHRLRSLNQNFALEQKLLRVQLNPHFIFNALGAIQHYMCNKTPYDAAKYLSKFSKLMRSILEGSRASKTTLSTELETIKNYLDLQSLRFSNPFEYSIELDPDLETDLIQIPSLIIQPLLENAIEHGLRPNQGGKLKIEISQKNGHVVIAVEDDGVGLDNSKNIAKPPGDKQSLGNTITRERLSLINRKSKRKIQFKVESRSKITKGLTGTRASLEIPIT